MRSICIKGGGDGVVEGVELAVGDGGEKNTCQ